MDLHLWMMRRDGFPLEIWKVQTSIANRPNPCCEVLKASAKQQLNCPALQCCVWRLPQISTALPPAWKLRDWLGDGCSRRKDLWRGAWRVYSYDKRQRHCPTVESPFLTVMAQCPPLPFNLFLLCVGTLHPLFCMCSWDIVSSVVLSCDATILG